MIFSYEWLKEFLPTMPEPKTLLEELTMHSVEVEEVDEGALELGNVVVGELLDTRKHPDADKLNIGIFDVGEEKPRQIIYGGVAVLEVGIKIPVALAPTVLPGKLKIKERHLRGELSQGMCCLNSELGILDREDVINEFDEEVTNGTPIVGVLPLTETIVDIDNKSMTHRADLFSHMNMAREIAAVFNKPFTTPKRISLPTRLPKIDVDIQDTQSCRRYIGIEMEVTVGPSPDYIAQRLQTCGVKSINNVVDITNYVMLELGEPTHAFDAEKIAGGKIIVRRATKGETLMTLDHEKKLLNDSIVVIADAEKPMAIAGVIGGEESSVTHQTTKIVLEVANFEPLITRKAAQQISVRTEGALRWEKDLPPTLAQSSAERAVELLMEHASAILTGFVDIYPEKQKIASVELSQHELLRLSGEPFTTKQVKEYLRRIECAVKTKGSGENLVYIVTPPWFRMDIRIPADIIEEIVRLHGVNAINEKQLTAALHVGEQQKELPWIRVMKNSLQSYGLFEVNNYSFYGAGLMKKIGLDPEKEHLEITNPLSEDLRYLRTTLLPRLLENVARNQQYSQEFSLFEFGHVYFADREVTQLGIVSIGPEAYRRTKGIVEALLAELHVPYRNAMLQKSAPCEFWGMYNGDQAVRYDTGKNIAGTVGEVDPVVLHAMNIERTTAFASLSVPVLVESATTTFQTHPISQFPAIELDLSLIVDEDVEWSQIEKEIRSESQKLLQEVSVFDVYRGKKIPNGKKSISFRMKFQSNDSTLEMTAMEEWREKFVEKMHKKIGAELRAK